jgi:hypothetical protein
MDVPKRYSELQGDVEPGPESGRDRALVEEHIVRYWGKAEEVLEEIKALYVRLRLHVIAATAERPWHTVVTSGMSDRPMVSSKPDGPPRYAELMMALPPEWPVDRASFTDERYYWPFRHLLQTARFPHAFGTEIWWGHTIGNETPLQLYHTSQPFAGAILSLPILCEEGALALEISGSKKVVFFAFTPVYEDELRFAWKEGSKALIEKLDETGVTEVIDTARPSVVV